VHVSMTPIDRIEARLLRKDVPAFRPGDTVRVHVRVVEGDKERIQVFEGTVLGRSGGSSREMFTVRKASYGVGVERIFPVPSPRIERIEVVMRGAVRRAKLYYLRERTGRAARVAEKAAGAGGAGGEPGPPDKPLSPVQWGAGGRPKPRPGPRTDLLGKPFGSRERLVRPRTSQCSPEEALLGGPAAAPAAPAASAVPPMRERPSKVAPSWITRLCVSTSP